MGTCRLHLRLFMLFYAYKIQAALDETIYFHNRDDVSLLDKEQTLAWRIGFQCFQVYVIMFRFYKRLRTRVCLCVLKMATRFPKCLFE